MDVEKKQCLLKFLDYYEGRVDGIWGPNSRRATQNFQRDFGGLKVTGEFDDETAMAARHTVAYGLPGRDEAPEEETTGSFWDEIEFFDREEFRCQCGGRYCNGFPAEPQEQLVRILDQLRRNLGVPITIISGLRCPTHNANSGGVANSQHMYGEAADIKARGISQLVVEAELDRIGGVRYHYPIKGSNNVHFDIPKGNR